jgi:hypothetical protein
MLPNEILTHIFADTTHDFAAQFAQWLVSAPRFKTFAETYRDKIRKKVRGLRDEHGRRDLQFELAIAYRLLQERRFAVEYEKYGVGKQRGPDFSVSFRTRMLFNVEVKRMHIARLEPHADPLHGCNKLINTVCEKIGQLPPSVINLLALGDSAALGVSYDVALAMKLLKERADGKDDPFFARRGFIGARDFLKQYTRLSGILVCDPQDPLAAERPTLWLNAQARHAIPAELETVLRSCAEM